MKKTLLGITALLVVVFIAGCSGDSKAEESNDAKGEPITFGITPWTSTVPPTEIAKIILEDMGYEVDEKKADAGSVYTGLSRGDINVFMDSWLPAHNVYLEKYEDTLEDTATSYANVTAGWVVPTYMEDINTVEDVLGKEDLFNNEMYSIEEGTSASEKIDEMIEDYGLDINQVNSSEGAMLAMAMKKMDKEEPVIFYGWRPHTMFNTFDIKTLTDDRGHFGQSVSVHVITNNQLKEDAPEAYEFLSNWSIAVEDIEEMIAAIDEGKEPREVAQEWIDNNQDKVDEMLGK